MGVPRERLNGPRSGRVALLFTVFCLVLVACGGGADDVPGDSPSVPDTTSPPVDSGSLNAVIPPEITTLNPILQTEQGKASILSVIHTPLLQYNPQREIFSRLLETWEMAADGQSAALTLRDGLQWSDGEPITSADIITTLQIYLNSNISAHAARIGGVEGQQAYSDGVADSISGLSAIDDLTVEVRLDATNVSWLVNIAALTVSLPLLPDHVLGDTPPEELLDHTFFQQHPVSSGPFKFVEWRQGQHVEVERNDNWTMGPPASFERVFFLILESEVMIARLEAGEIEFGYPISPANAQRLGQGLTIRSAPADASELWTVLASDKFDHRVRQAMLFAIDREAICEEALRGFCSVPLLSARQLAPAWALPTIEDFPDLLEYRYDPERARQLLAEAEADGAWDPDTELVFYMWHTRDYAVSAVTLAQGMMADVGINWSVINSDLSGMLAAMDRHVDGDDSAIDGLYQSGAVFVLDPVATEIYVRCDTHYPGGANAAFWCDPELDALFEAGRQVVSEAERAPHYQAAFARINQAPPFIEMYTADTIQAHDSRLKGTEPHGNLANQYWNIASWYWEE